MFAFNRYLSGYKRARRTVVHVIPSKLGCYNSLYKEINHKVTPLMTYAHSLLVAICGYNYK